MALKSIAKKLFDTLGVNDTVIRRRRSDLLVLCYHGVIAEPRPDHWNYENWVDRKTFRDQLRWLKGIMEPTDLAGLVRWQSGEWTNSKGPVLITFDDGYRNNVTEAAPILKQEGVPALFFLTTGYIGTARTLWPDEIRMRVLHCLLPSLRMPSGEIVHVPSARPERQQLADRIARLSKQLEENARSEFLAYLRSEIPAVEIMDDPEARAFMNWDEARKLRAMGFKVGAHTVQHPILSRVERSRVAIELKQSKSAIERELDCPCTALAYPNGTVRDVNDEVVEESRNAGFEWGFMTTPLWRTPGQDPYRIPRVVVPGHADLATFKLYASGLQMRLSGAA